MLENVFACILLFNVKVVRSDTILSTGRLGDPLENERLLAVSELCLVLGVSDQV